MQEIKDEYPPKASFGSNEELAEDLTADTSASGNNAAAADDLPTEEAFERTLTAELENCTVVATVPLEAQLPEDIQLQVKQIKANSKQYRAHLEEARQALADDPSLTEADPESGAESSIDSFLLFDIAFTKDGQESGASGSRRRGAEAEGAGDGGGGQHPRPPL